MTHSLVLEKAFAFALRIVKLYQYLANEKHEFVLSKQLLIAGTYVGKHIKEATGAESKMVFTQEMAIALRKTTETEYWLQLLYHAEFLSKNQFESIDHDRLEILKMLTKIVKTSKLQNQ